MEYIEQLGKRAKKASYLLATAKTDLKNKALEYIAQELENNTELILKENKKDIDNAQQNGISGQMIDRLALNEKRIADMATGVRKLIDLDDPVGAIDSEWTRPNGLKIGKMRVPLGVIAIIFESRPNVTVDAAALCLKSGNAVILRGGKEAINSNLVLVQIMREALEKAGLDQNCINIVENTDRQTATALMKLNKYVDVLIPRGGAGLIKAAVENATVPVIETGTGNCHIFVDQSADLDMAIEVIINAKTSRVSVCNAAESLVVHTQIADKLLPVLFEKLNKKGVELRGCEKSCQIIDCQKANDDDFYREYLDYIISCKVVDSIDSAIEFINEHSTSHSEAIITKDTENAKKFQSGIDSAAVYVNASTRFTDGFEFGFGAEIGISTQKIHARGPMGLEALTSVKYVIDGNGQTR